METFEIGWMDGRRWEPRRRRNLAKAALVNAMLLLAAGANPDAVTHGAPSPNAKTGVRAGLTLQQRAYHVMFLPETNRAIGGHPADFPMVPLAQSTGC